MEHIWKIYNLKRTIADGVVNEISYACESNHLEHTTREIGVLEITGSASDEGFIAYEDLNEGDVLAWVTGSSEVDTAAIENICSASIANHIEDVAAITEENGLPWDN